MSSQDRLNESILHHWITTSFHSCEWNPSAPLVSVINENTVWGYRVVSKIYKKWQKVLGKNLGDFFSPKQDYSAVHTNVERCSYCIYINCSRIYILYAHIPLRRGAIRSCRNNFNRCAFACFGESCSRLINHRWFFNATQ